MLVTFYRIRAFHEVVVQVQHINAIMHEVETIHKVMSCILDRDKDLVQKTRVQEIKMISVFIPSSVDV
jgi:hypothetical protein